MMGYTYQKNEYLPYNEFIGLYNWDIIGYSSEERPIVNTVIGQGSRNICIWAGMHGNETTGIHIILQLIEMLQSKQVDLSDFKLHIIPVIAGILVPLLSLEMHSSTKDESVIIFQY